MVVLPEMCVPMPESLTYEEGAACSCGTGTAYQALKRLGVSGRDTFAVFGQGPVGLNATLFGAATGANVIAIDPIKERRELALRLGASHTIDPTTVDPIEAIKEITNGLGAEASLDASGVGEVRRTSVMSTRIWGRACFVGEGGSVIFEDVTNDIIHRQVTLLGSWTFSTVILEELGNYIVNRNIPLKDILLYQYSLESIEEAFALFEGETNEYSQHSPRSTFDLDNPRRRAR